MSGRTRNLAQNIDGITGDEEIAAHWREKFATVLHSVDDGVEKKQVENKLSLPGSEELELISVEEIREAVLKLKLRKTVGMDEIPAEFFRFADVCILKYISVFINCFVLHCFLPESVMNVYMSPLVKNRTEDNSRSENYRPIAIATAISKLIEFLILNRLEGYLNSSDNQFGFKRDVSTELCIFSLKEVISYYLSKNTPVFTCFLDVKSAYDRVSYWRVFNKLLERKVPLYIVRFLAFWFQEQKIFIKWGCTYSEYFNMFNGLRQGAVMSPYLFNVYVDELNILLNKCGVGCHVAGKPMNNFSYADDLVLACPSASALQDMIGVCESFARNNYIKFSILKTKCMCICLKDGLIRNPPNIYLDGSVVEYVNRFKYLGHIITRDFCDDDDIMREVRSLSIRGNTLIRKFNFCSHDVKKELFRTFCSSLYTGALWSKYKQCTFRRLQVTYNNIMRRLINVPPWESARQMFVSIRVRTLPEMLRCLQYSTMTRVLGSMNSMVVNVRESDAKFISKLWQKWSDDLFIR